MQPKLVNHFSKPLASLIILTVISTPWLRSDLHVLFWKKKTSLVSFLLSTFSDIYQIQNLDFLFQKLHFFRPTLRDVV